MSISFISVVNTRAKMIHPHCPRAEKNAAKLPLPTVEEVRKIRRMAPSVCEKKLAPTVCPRYARAESEAEAEAKTEVGKNLICMPWEDEGRAARPVCKSPER
jgi:hypothetical protein